MQRDLSIPDFLKETADDIHKRMLSKAPPDVSIIEGDFFWDNTRPAAEEKASLLQKALQGILKLSFPQSSYGIWLEYLGECKGVFKNPATEAMGILKVKGTTGTVLEKGKIAGTVASDVKDSIGFEFTESKSIDESGIAYINSKCLIKGSIGNVKAGGITILLTSINGVESIINEKDFTGGTDIEEEEHFRERVVESEQEEQLSGADADYIRWAKEVEGVGYAIVTPEWNGPNSVKVTILDKNKQSASEKLIQKVQNYIAPIVPKGQNRGGKAPVGAIVTVETTVPLVLNIKIFNLKAYNLEQAIEDIRVSLKEFLKCIIPGETIKLKKIEAIITQTQGVLDFSEIKLNDSDNIVLNYDEFAILGDVTLPTYNKNATLEITFETIDEINITHGVYEKSNKRLVI